MRKLLISTFSLIPILSCSNPKEDLTALSSNKGDLILKGNSIRKFTCRLLKTPSDTISDIITSVGIGYEMLERGSRRSERHSSYFLGGWHIKVIKEKENNGQKFQENIFENYQNVNYFNENSPGITYEFNDFNRCKIARDGLCLPDSIHIRRVLGLVGTERSGFTYLRSLYRNNGAEYTGSAYLEMGRNGPYSPADFKCTLKSAQSDEEILHAAFLSNPHIWNKLKKDHGIEKIFPNINGKSCVLTPNDPQYVGFCQAIEALNCKITDKKTSCENGKNHWENKTFLVKFKSPEIDFNSQDNFEIEILRK